MIVATKEIESLEELDEYIKESAAYSKRFYASTIHGMDTGLVATASTLEGQGLMFKAFWKKVKKEDWNQVHQKMTDNDFVFVGDVYVR